MNLVKLVLALALAVPAISATISTVSVQTKELAMVCSKTDVVSASCQSNNASATALISGNGFSLFTSVGSFVASADAKASITQTDLYSVAFAGPLFGRIKEDCNPHNGFALFAIMGGSPTPCASFSQPLYPIFVLFPVTVNSGIASIQTHLEGEADPPGIQIEPVAGIDAQITFLGFQDSNGAPVSATLLPEPGSWGLLAAGLVAIGFRRKVLTRHPRQC